MQPIPDPCRRRGVERDDAARARRRAPAPPAPPAGRPHPLRGPALEGERGRGAARHERRVGEQRAPAGAGHARGEQPRPGDAVALGRRGRRASCSRATSRRSRRTTWTRSPSLIQEDAIQSMPPFDMWLRGRDDIFTWWYGPGIGCKGSRVIPTVVRQRRARVRPVQAERDGQRLRPVGAPGARDRGRQDRRGSRSSSTPETLFPLFGLPRAPRLASALASAP